MGKLRPNRPTLKKKCIEFYGKIMFKNEKMFHVKHSLYLLIH